jgi:Activator of Hsp90 ATPase homolog 1-like protein
MSEREGRLTVDGDCAVLNFERRLPFPVDVVWSAITDPGEREEWFGETTIDAREGGTIEMVAAASWCGTRPMSSNTNGSNRLSRTVSCATN